MLARIRDSEFFRANSRTGALVRNAGVLITGNATNAVLSLIYLMIVTRALGLQGFGLYGLYIAYIALLTRVTNFQTWQALISFGAPAHKRGESALLKDLLYLGWVLDVLSGLVGYGLAVTGALLVPAWFGLGDEALFLTAIVATMMLFNWRNSPLSLLRILDAFVSQAVFNNLVAALQLIAVTALYFTGEDRLVVYLAVTTVNNIIGQLALFAYAYLRARRAGLLTGGRFDLASLPRRCPGITRFVVSTNADGLVRSLRDIDLFIVNALLGVAAAGLYRIARIVTRAIGQVTGPFYQTIYPELTRAVADGDAVGMAQLMRNASLILGLLTFVGLLCFLVVGEFLLGFAFGEAFGEAWAVTAWCIAGMVVWGLTHSLSPAMMAWKRADTALKVNFLTTCAYVAGLYGLALSLGLVGAGIALFFFYSLWGVVMFVIVRRHWQSMAAA